MTVHSWEEPKVAQATSALCFRLLRRPCPQPLRAEEQLGGQRTHGWEFRDSGSHSSSATSHVNPSKVPDFSVSVPGDESYPLGFNEITLGIRGLLMNVCLHLLGENLSSHPLPTREQSGVLQHTSDSKL